MAGIALAAAALAWAARAELARIGPPGELAERLAIAAGLGIDEIGVTGFHRTPAEEIFAALDAGARQSLFSYDTSAARARLEEFAWVRSASVTRVLPDRLAVRITERLPFAVWQQRGMLFLIDAEGRELQPIGPSEYRLLPMVAGAGAAGKAREILLLVAHHPEIASRFEAAIRVGDRRWTLRLKGGIELLLPEAGEAEALERASASQAEERLFDRALTRIDMRVPGRLTLTVAKRAAPAVAGGA